MTAPERRFEVTVVYTVTFEELPDEDESPLLDADPVAFFREWGSRDIAAYADGWCIEDVTERQIGGT